MLPVRVIGGPGKEVPPKESKNDPQEKRTVRSRRNCRAKCGDRLGTALERICAPLVEDMLMPLAIRLACLSLLELLAVRRG
jgi:hypothetical protein